MSLKFILKISIFKTYVKTEKYPLKLHVTCHVPVLYPEVFWGGQFFNECSEQKNRITAEGSGVGVL